MTAATTTGDDVPGGQRPNELDKPTPKKRGGRAPKLDPGRVGEALAKHQGNVAAVARQFGVHRSSVHELICRRADLQQITRDSREGMKDDAESALYKAVREGEAWAVCFYLKTQGKDRGYCERSEVQTANRVTLEVVEEIVPAGLESTADGGQNGEGPTG